MGSVAPGKFACILGRSTSSGQASNWPRWPMIDFNQFTWHPFAAFVVTEATLDYQISVWSSSGVR